MQIALISRKSYHILSTAPSGESIAFYRSVQIVEERIPHQPSQKRSVVLLDEGVVFDLATIGELELRRPTLRRYTGSILASGNFPGI
jgi:hypothetical protein